MLVFRVESKDGNGPYVNSDLGYEDYYAHSDMPFPYSDFKGLGLMAMSEWNRDKYYYAFPCIELFKTFWREDTLRRLTDKGYLLAVYEVDDADTFIGHSGLQCAFRKKKSKLIDSVPLIKEK